MIRISIFLPTKKRRKYSHAIYSLFITFVVIQSTFANATNDISYHSSGNFIIPTMQKVLVDPVLDRDANLFIQDNVQDECVDCDASCCACCASTLLTFIYALNRIKPPIQLNYGDQLARFKTPYDSLLRPPKR
ncbi:MAG: hypothetical protein AXW17_11260 [Colwellia sp. Phe_37]|nr:MAG: hypothetical protein AXW17_11260 [Colwellia sp. Phe_37]|tara:strand:+ start:15046 stop:15444 length:399 start_codon:yes stop_codon:yes gene_type:complete